MLPMLSLSGHLVEAICDLTFECLKFLFSRFHLHSIESRIGPRKICNSFTKIDIIKYFCCCKLTLIHRDIYSNSYLTKIQRVTTSVNIVFYK